MAMIVFTLLFLMAVLLGSGMWIGIGLIGTGIGLVEIFKPNLPALKLLSQQSWNTAVPQSVLYDNDRCLVAKILPDGTRKRAELFSGFLSHYLIRDRYGRPGHRRCWAARSWPRSAARRRRPPRPSGASRQRS
ncbi:hypothetical protein [Paracoccus mutanolyticus]|uniref:hypothetical protein n=1 Tax=Paracoccus mutanolyticus TaxID=1499308 RepID=UPI001CB8F8E0|nr:hypothetical protein [Paracoccus mutanolyticus]